MDPGLGSNLGLTSEVRKALKLSAKSITDDKWKQHDVYHLGCTAMVTTKTSRHALYYVITQMAYCHPGIGTKNDLLKFINMHEKQSPKHK